MGVDGLESFEGPRTLRYFRLLLIIVVCLFALGVTLSVLYDFTLLEDMTRGFVENPMALLDLAGFLAFIAFVITAFLFVLKHVD